MSGFNATTTDSISSIAVAARSLDSSIYKSSLVRVYFRSSENMRIVPDEEINILSEHTNTEEGYVEYHVSPAIEEWRMQIVRTNSDPGQFTFQGLMMDNEASGIVYHTIGVNGASTASYLRCKDFPEQMQSMHPDLAILAIGVNDANVPEGSFDQQAYIGRYDSILTALKIANPKIHFLFITNNDTYYKKRYPNRNAFEVRNAIEHLANKYNGAVYDWFEVMGGLGSIRKWKEAGLAAGDLVHFTKAGYQLEADLFFNAFVGSFNTYLERRYGKR
jgi:lysophospholipase L1-like esterase